MKKNAILTGMMIICLILLGGFSKTNAQTSYDIRVTIGPTDCDALQYCSTWEITVYEYNPTTQTSQAYTPQNYSYGTQTYDFPNLKLDPGYTQFYSTITLSGSCSCGSCPHYNKQSGSWTAGYPYYHAFTLDPCVP